MINLIRGTLAQQIQEQIQGDAWLETRKGKQLTKGLDSFLRNRFAIPKQVRLNSPKALKIASETRPDGDLRQEALEWLREKMSILLMEALSQKKFEPKTDKLDAAQASISTRNIPELER